MGLKTTILKSSHHQSNNSIEPHLGGNVIQICKFEREILKQFYILFVAILDIEDESDYWCVVQKHTKNKGESIAAGKICSLFLPVTKQLKYLLFFVFFVLFRLYFIYIII